MYAKYLLAKEESSTYLPPVSPLLLEIYEQKKNVLQNFLLLNGYENHMQLNVPILHCGTNPCPLVGISNRIFATGTFQ